MRFSRTKKKKKSATRKNLTTDEFTARNTLKPAARRFFLFGRETAIDFPNVSPFILFVPMFLSDQRVIILLNHFFGRLEVVR